MAEPIARLPEGEQKAELQLFLRNVRRFVIPELEAEITGRMQNPWPSDGEPASLARFFLSLLEDKKLKSKQKGGRPKRRYTAC